MEDLAGDRSQNVEARERKRQRDKQNQRQKRKREKDTVQELQRRNASLERQVEVLQGGGDKTVQDLLTTVRLLRARNEALTKRLSRANDFVTSWTSENKEEDLTGEVDDDEGQRGSNEVSEVNYDNLPANARPLQPGQLSSNEGRVIETDEDETSTPDVSASTADQPFPGSSPEPQMTGLSEAYTSLNEFIGPGAFQSMIHVPVWQRIPKKSDGPGCWNPFGSIIDKMQASPDKFQTYNIDPEAMDILCGGSLNELANVAFHFTTRLALPRAEMLALSWMSYRFTRWIIDPSEENFNRVPSILQPSPVQYFIPHQPIFDYVVWPRVRDNLITYRMKYCRPEVFDLLFSCCRLRDPPNDFVIRSANELLELNPAFLELISKIDEWTLLDRFWTEYPELVFGLHTKFRSSSHPSKQPNIT